MPVALTRHQVQATMGGLKGSVQACYDRHRVSGLAQLEIEVEPSGHVSKVRVRGDLESSPTGACIEKIVQAATFPSFLEFQTKPTRFTYPFVLR